MYALHIYFYIEQRRDANPKIPILIWKLTKIHGA